MRTSADEGHSLWQVDLLTGAGTRLTEAPGLLPGGGLATDREPTWAPDGSLWFVSTRAGVLADAGHFEDPDLYELDVVSGDVRRRTWTPHAERAPTFLSVGKVAGEIVFSTLRDAVGDQEGGHLFRFPPDLHVEYHVHFGITAPEDLFLNLSELPDGRYVATLGDLSGAWDSGRLGVFDRNFGPEIGADQPADSALPFYAPPLARLDPMAETVGIYAASGALLHEPVVGDVSSGPFPATDAEIGELFNFVTAPFTVDGDQTCQHCHREGGNIDKAFSMPLSRALGVGLRQTMDYRGAADTRPWFFESAMDESNFVPVMNEFARIENFCCSDYTLWPEGAPPGCSSDPPPECGAEPNPYSTNGASATRSGPMTHAAPRPTSAPSRDVFYLERIEEMIGRTRSFGDGLFWEDPITDERNTVPLDFDGITRALGLFLMQDTGLLPNPNDADRASVRRGQALFEGHDTACATCHPAPTFAVSTDVGGLGVPLTMGPVVSPLRDALGNNLDLLAGAFLAAFPRAGMDQCEDVCAAEVCAADPFACDDLMEVDFGVPSLRGIWDRADSMLHHGLGKGLREVLCTPGHPALGPGEVGRNERDGIPDTHGGTSHLSPQELEDLIEFVRTM